MPKLKVIINSKELGIYTVSLFGPLDTITHTTLEKEIEAILTPSTKALILNMEGVNYISSMGIGSLFKIVNVMKGHNSSVVFTNLQPQIKKVFDTVKVLPEAIFTSMEEVDTYLNAIQNKEIDQRKPPSL